MKIKIIQFGEERLKNSIEQASPVVRQSHESDSVGRGGAEKKEQLINQLFTFVTDLKAIKERYSDKLSY